jgi:hypothetical protein
MALVRPWRQSAQRVNAGLWWTGSELADATSDDRWPSGWWRSARAGIRGYAAGWSPAAVSTPNQRRPVSTWWRRALPSLGLTLGLGLIATAGVESAISIPVTPQIGTVPAVQTPASAGLTGQP